MDSTSDRLIYSAVPLTVFQLSVKKIRGAPQGAERCAPRRHPLCREAQQCRKPARAGDETFSLHRQFAFLQLFQCGRVGLALGFADSIEHLLLPDAVEVVFSGRREPVLHVELQRCGELVTVLQTVDVRAVVVCPDGVNREGRTAGQQVQQRFGLLLQAP
jgi:hypothetical protein